MSQKSFPVTECVVSAAIGFALAAALVGSGSGTPDSCKQALRIDNQIFDATGSAFYTAQYGGLSDQIQSVADERAKHYNKCMST